MKKNIRLLSMLLVLCMAIGMLTACGSASESAASAASSAAVPEAASAENAPAEAAPAAPDEAETPAEEAASSEEAPAQSVEAGEVAWPANPLGDVELPLTEEPVTITLWMGVNPNVLAITEDIGNDCRIWNELGERTGVHVEFTAVNPDSQSEKFNLMIASDDLTDVISNATNMYTNGGEAAVADEILIDHLPLLTEELTPQICKIMEAYPDAVPNVLTDSGWLAGMPQLSMQTESTQTFGPQIRKDWLEKVNMDTPETYDELHDVLAAFRDQLGADAPLVISYAGTGFRDGLIEGYGILGTVADSSEATEPFYQINDEVQFGPIQPEFKDYLEMVHQWYEEGLIWSDFMSATDLQNPPTEMILADRVGVFYGEVTFMATLGATSEDPDFELVALPDFVQKKGDQIPFNDDSDYTAQTPWSISTACECPELVMQWCNYMYTNEGATLCNYGIENESFVYGEDGAPALTDLVLNNPDMSTTVALFMYCMDRGPFYRDEVREQSGYTPNQKAASAIWQSNMTTGRSIGTTSLNTDESDEVNKYYGDIKTYIEEKVLAYITGTESLDSFDGFVADIKAMGIDEVIAQYQEAYQRHLEGGDPMPMGDPGPPPDGAPPPA